MRARKTEPESPRPTVAAIHAAVRAQADPAKARILQGFFKTGPGDYGEGDIFLGLVVPKIRNLARTFRALSLSDTPRLLASPVHEERLLALLILVDRFQTGTATEKRAVFRAYLDHTERINNWDLVDLSASQIVGAHLAERNRSLLARLAKSPRLWERRIAIIATFHFIRLGQFEDTFRIADRLLHDGHDLIHKAVGWMLREVGKRDQPAEERFLAGRYRAMPRTMLRYAIERFAEPRRRAYLAGRA